MVCLLALMPLTVTSIIIFRIGVFGIWAWKNELSYNMP